MKIQVLLLAGLSFMPAAWADVVHLKDGRALEGAVSVKDGRVIVRHRFGEVRVDESDVLQIEETEDAWDELARRRASESQGTADERYRFAIFARENGFKAEARRAFLGVLRVDTNHPGARAALGYVQHEGRWVTEDDRNRALGLIEYRGAWITPEKKAELQEQGRLELALARQAKADAREARREEREAEREARRERIRERELELAEARAQLRAQEEYDDRRQGIIYGRYGGGYYPGYGGGYRLGGPVVAPYPSGYSSGYSSYYNNRCGSRGSSFGGYYDGGNWGLRWRFGY